ncbi:MAG: family 43 glycosylhydrolase, partial [Clostridiales bacterium]|nr:family 43 glycosylhydrolase [Clostridiales bacterium]
FTPAQGSWAREQVYAPECVYSDGKYYLFFSANEKYCRPDGMFFTSREDKKAYYTEKAKIDAMDLTAATAKMNEQIAKFDGKTEVEGYTEEQIGRAQESIDRYKSLKADIDASEADRDEKDAELLELTRTALAEFEAMEVNADLYLGYSATFSICLAVSDTPVGPFVQYTNVSGQEGYDPNKREIAIGEPFITHEDLAGVPVEQRVRIMSHIDVNPFEDPKTHKKYVYLSNTFRGQTEMFGVEIGDNWTDDLDRTSVTHMTTLGYKDIDKTEKTDYIFTSNIEEGPHMYYDAASDNYYLTFSINGCYDRGYAVAQALGKEPLGKFTKVDLQDGGLMCAADDYWDHVTATGHHCFITYDNKLYIAYQTLIDREGSGSGDRGICVDEVKFITNDKGQKLMYTNGPTYSPMPKIGPDAQYRNIAESAAVTATNGENGTRAEYLNDGLLTATLNHDIGKEYDA